MPLGDSPPEYSRAPDIVIVYEFDDAGEVESVRRDVARDTAVRSIRVDANDTSRVLVAFDSSDLQSLVRINRRIEAVHNPISRRFTAEASDRLHEAIRDVGSG